MLALPGAVYMCTVAQQISEATLHGMGGTLMAASLAWISIIDLSLLCANTSS